MPICPYALVKLKGTNLPPTQGHESPDKFACFCSPVAWLSPAVQGCLYRLPSLYPPFTLHLSSTLTAFFASVTCQKVSSSIYNLVLHMFLIEACIETALSGPFSTSKHYFKAAVESESLSLLDVAGMPGSTMSRKG